ncbi:MAG: large conductance mechanosensitive channel protein MscL [Faecousia sp.]
MSKKIKKPSWWDEFKAFAVKGNAMALAVGTIIGGAFSTITKSLTNDIIMPIVNIFLGGTDFSNWKLALPRAPWVAAKYTDVLDEAGNVVGQQEVINYLTFGNFIAAIINFLILALVVFWLVKGLNKLAESTKKKEEEAAAAEPPVPPAPSNEEVLLGEIRDLLKNK